VQRILIAFIATTVLSLGLVGLPAGRGLIDRVFFPDEATLREGLDETIALVQGTADVASAASDSQLSFTADHRLEPIGNADPDQIDELSNNYSFSDHSHKARYPGFDDCDHASNVFDDGWSATYGLMSSSGHLSDEEQRQVLEAVRAYWQSLGYVLSQPQAGVDQSELSGLGIETEYGRIGFSFNPRRGTASVSGTTNCLPPG